MRYFIKIEENQAVGFPMQQDNFEQAFPNEDLDNLSSSFAEVIKADVPARSVYQILDDPTYTMNADGKMVETFTLSDVSDERKIELQNEAKAAWVEDEDNFASWVFNEETCSYEAPVSYPSDGKNYYWNEPTTSWVEVT
tara:strand:- start:4111 stop:4527 length:417 start_codon:yes stop_codon:yes gene_type:complete